MKKRILTLMLAGVMALSLTACAAQQNSGTAKTEAAKTEAEKTEAENTELENTEAEKPEESAGTQDSAESSAPETVTITSLNGSGEEIQLEVPYRPQRVAILDMPSLDIIDSLGEGGSVVGSASTSLDYLQSYVTDEAVANLGTIKEADLEAVMACEPDLIFIGGRLSSAYDDLSAIAPVVYLATDTEKGVVKSVYDNAAVIASIFGKEEEVEGLMEGFDARIQKLAAFAEGKTAIVGLCTSGGFNILGNDGRCSLIGNEIGFENIGLDAETNTSTHGNEASFEFVVEKNPEYIFVMDRDAAINAEGAQLAKEIVENELVMGTDAYKNGTIIYLEHPAVWYTAEGGIHALNIMLEDLEGVLA